MFFFPSDTNCSDGVSFGFGLRRAVFKGRVVAVGAVFLVSPSFAGRPTWVREGAGTRRTPMQRRATSSARNAQIGVGSIGVCSHHCPGWHFFFVKKQQTNKKKKKKEFAGASTERKEELSGMPATGGDKRSPTDCETDFAEDCWI